MTTHDGLRRQPRDPSADEEIDRVLRLGAREVVDRRQPDGSGWMVLEDPAGNHFCILRREAERIASRLAQDSNPPD